MPENNPSRSVLLATRPLVPPWDEASKNFAYFLGRSVSHHRLTLLTAGEKLEDLPASAREVPLFSSGHFDWRSKWELLSYLIRKSRTFDVIHYLFTPTALNTGLIRFLARPEGVKTVQTIATLRDDLYSPRALKDLLFADQLIVYTDRTKEKLSKLGFQNVTRIYPGIDLERYSPKSKDENLLRQFGFDASHFLVIYPGEYVRLGATDMLTDAVIRYFQAYPDTNLRFVFACRVKNAADAAKKEEVMTRLEAAGVSKFVAYSDTISDMPALYNTADVVAFPVGNLSGKFDVPLIIIEAYACGKPVILSDLPQFSEFANEAICVTIPTGSGEKFFESVAYLKDNKAICEHLGLQARAFVKDHFDLKNTAKQYEEIYSSL